ncbi:alkaline protease secretion ATP-binding protein AprD [Maritalea myrionectae]|uniref:Alkaline protease secretion ATP-binding protein AprD n=1 Tax=Maritalea myrionectae TaxID=454601 RepID=A0A2R4MC54_9HYPH|nr:type I secretion system permease/ATPase [Maritalea myrionectae]AVX03476.1 alkaline protease secretion ATP-binding protein AprD [Maritalea myrionectae]
MAGNQSLIRERLHRVRKVFFAVALMSCVVNILMLTGPLFMLQVYDRVLASQSVPTLLALGLLAIGLYVMMGFFDFVRARSLSRLSFWLDTEISPLTYKFWIARSLCGQNPAYRPIQDIGIVRNFLASPTVLALFDLPWFPIYLGIVFLLHPSLGILAVCGAIVVVVLAILNEFFSRKPSAEGVQNEMIEARFADQAQKNADSVLAMGMLESTQTVWQKLRNRSLFSQQLGGERSEGFTASSKSFRLMLQSGILALGAFLAINQEITAGTIVAASIIAGRALAPIDQTLGGWRVIKRAQLAWQRLKDYLKQDSNQEDKNIELPEVQGNLEVKSVVKYAPSKISTTEKSVILGGIDFSLKPGDGLGVIGPSASGKSTLAKLLVGLWMPDAGTVRVDGATFEQWDSDQIGRSIGYLPQQVALLSGSIGQNIARFDNDAEDAEVVEAAKLAGVHEMILSFPEGYGTNVDAALSPLTGGQVQRIGLARALFRRPKLIVLDEPNANLDQEGDAALSQAISQMREFGSVVVVIAHRPSAISAVDKILMLNAGRMVEMGDKSDVLKKITRVA